MLLVPCGSSYENAETGKESEIDADFLELDI